MELFTLLKNDNFRRVRDIKPFDIDDLVIRVVRKLDESHKIEPWIQIISK